MFRQRSANANQLRAYQTRPAKFNQHECELPWANDYRYGYSYESAREAQLRPEQVACTDCGALWTMANETKHGTTTQTVSRTEYVPHPHPHWQGGPVARTVRDTVEVPITVNEQFWVFEQPQAAPPGAPVSPDGKFWSDGGKWIPIPGTQLDAVVPVERAHRGWLRRRTTSIRHMTPPSEGNARQFDWAAYHKEQLVKDVEAALSSLPQVVKCAVVWIPDPRFGEVPRIFVEPVLRQSLYDVERTCRLLLRRHVSEALIDQQTIQYWKLPVTQAGAVDKDRLRRGA